VNKNTGEPTEEMRLIFHQNYAGNKENIPKAISALKEYGLFPLSAMRVLTSELHISLFEAKRMVAQSNVYHSNWF
jgi:hypothetical protein